MGWLACECASSRHGDREEVQRKRPSCRSAELPSYKARMQAVQETRRRSGKGKGKGKGVGWCVAVERPGQLGHRGGNERKPDVGRRSGVDDISCPHGRRTPRPGGPVDAADAATGAAGAALGIDRERNAYSRTAIVEKRVCECVTAG